MRHFAYLLEASWLTRRLAALEAQHLHAHFGTNPAAVALLVRALGGPPFSFTVHGPDEFDAPLTLSLPTKSRATFVAAISSYGRSQLMRWSKPEEWQKIGIVRCGVDETFLGAERLDVPADSQRIRLCCTAVGAKRAAASHRGVRAAAIERRIFQSDDHRRWRDAGRARGGDPPTRTRALVRLAGVRSSAEIREQLLGPEHSSCRVLLKDCRSS